MNLFYLEMSAPRGENKIPPEYRKVFSQLHYFLVKNPTYHIGFEPFLNKEDSFRFRLFSEKDQALIDFKVFAAKEFEKLKVVEKKSFSNELSGVFYKRKRTSLDKVSHGDFKRRVKFVLDNISNEFQENSFNDRIKKLSKILKIDSAILENREELLSFAERFKRVDSDDAVLFTESKSSGQKRMVISLRKYDVEGPVSMTTNRYGLSSPDHCFSIPVI